jgi:hypothetical protein
MAGPAEHGRKTRRQAPPRAVPAPSPSYVLTRLGRLAESGRAGLLQVPGELGGAIGVASGQVVWATCHGTLGPGPMLAAAASHGPLSPLAQDCVTREATVDAVRELLSGRRRYVRFRAGEERAAGPGDGLPVAVITAEVARRQRVLEQFAALLTPDTGLARNPAPPAHAIQLSDDQWAMVMRATGPATARSLALDLGLSVFRAAIEVFRLHCLGLLTVTGPAGPQAAAAGRSGTALSFLRAVWPDGPDPAGGWVSTGRVYERGVADDAAGA